MTQNQKHIVSYPYILMKKDIQIATKIKHFSEIFDKRTYKVFKSVISSIVCLRNWKQADIANFSGKTLGQIQYFFRDALWDHRALNALRVQWIRNKIWWACDKKSDIVCYDATITTKNKASTFSGLTNWFYSNKDKRVVNGFEILGSSIITQSWLKYVLDVAVFFKKKKLNSKDKRTPSLLNEAWRKFMTKTLSQTKAWLVVLDSWFKWPDMCKWIYTIMKRHFLVRIGKDQICYNQNHIARKISKLLTEKTATHFSNGKLWIFQSMQLKSWLDKSVNIPVNIIVFHKNGFRSPMVLASSASLEDIYENMIRKTWDPSWKESIGDTRDIKNTGNIENAENTGNITVTPPFDEKKVYYAFVLLYSKRWSIETCFKELKSYLWLENFQVQSHHAIMKYLHIVILVHTLLYIMLATIYSDEKAFAVIYGYLKEKRNIKQAQHKDKKITFIWLKLFIEMLVVKWGLTSMTKSYKTLSPLFKTSISLKSWYCLIDE